MIFDFLGKELKQGDSVTFCKSNELYKGTISHFTKYMTAIMFVDYDGAIKCVYIHSNKIIKLSNGKESKIF